MAVLKAESEVICGMAGPVNYFTNPCPHGEQPMFGGGKMMVGSIACQMCKHYGGQVDDDSIECKHE